MSEKAKAPHSITLAWKIPWTEEPGRLQSMGSRRVGHDWATSLSLSCIGEGNGNPLQFPAWRIPGTEEPGGLPSVGSHRVGHDWRDLAAAAAICVWLFFWINISFKFIWVNTKECNVKSMFTFVRNSQLYHCSSSCTIFQHHQQRMRIPVAHTLTFCSLSFHISTSSFYCFFFF